MTEENNNDDLITEENNNDDDDDLIAEEIEEIVEANISNFSNAFIAYHDDQDYHFAISLFREVIDSEKSFIEIEEIDDDYEEDEYDREIDDGSDTIAKAMYWLGESFVKIDQIDNAIEVFESLSFDYPMHYLSPSAKRRSSWLKNLKEDRSQNS